MSKPAEIEAMVKACEAEFGGVDILVNNAGIQHVANVEDFPAERWDAIIAINLSSAFHTMRLALPGMKARNWGRIINIASAHGLVASAAEVGLCRGQARHRRPDQGGGAGNGDHRHHRQRDLPGLGADAAGAEAGRRPRREGRRRRRRSQAPPAGREAAFAAVRHARAARRPGACSCARRPPTRCAAWPGTWTAAGSRSDPSRLRRGRTAVQRVSCTLPLTVTVTVALPASTGSGLVGHRRPPRRASPSRGAAHGRGASPPTLHLAQQPAAEAEQLRALRRPGRGNAPIACAVTSPSTFSRASRDSD